MSKFPDTPEQTSVIETVTQTSDNIIIRALAGAAKTSTLIRIAESLPKVSILCLAFNKRIAVEMQERLPPNCTAMTLNSLGHRVWADAISPRLKVVTDKNYNLLNDELKKLPKGEQNIAYNEFSDILKIIDFGKSCGYIPTGQFKEAKALMNDAEFFRHLEEEPSRLVEDLVRAVTIKSIEMAKQGYIDFGDQILMPTLFPSMFPHYPLVMVDETQDLSALNHATLRKLAKKRLIAVGDENQSIYGFRGAHQNSMELLQETFSMKSKVLSVSFRCPIAVVKEAQWRAPHMQWPEWAKPGIVQNLFEWDADSIPEEAAIICRNNAPLFSMAIKLLKNGRLPRLIGNDIGAGLLKIMKKFGKTSLSFDEVMIAIAQWTEDTLKKTRSKNKVYDKAECMKIFARQGRTLGEAIVYAEHLFASQGPIQLMTGHKAKGLEFDTVFFLDHGLMNMEDGQDRNLKYVVQTRSKNELYYVESSDFVDHTQRTSDDMAYDHGPSTISQTPAI